MDITVKGVLSMFLGVTLAQFFDLISTIDAGIVLLVVLMGLDYISGLSAAIFFKCSKKTARGRCSSKVATLGLLKKGLMLGIVLVGFLLDRYIHQTFIADSVCVAFIISEIISLTENFAIIGIPMPNILKDVLEILNKKTKFSSGKK